MKTTKTHRGHSRSTASLRLDRITSENAAQFFEEHLFAKTRREYLEWKSRLAGKRRFAGQLEDIKRVLQALSVIEALQKPSPWEITRVPRPYRFWKDLTANALCFSLDTIKTDLAKGSFMPLQQQRKNVHVLGRIARYFKKEPIAQEQLTRAREHIKTIEVLELAYDQIFNADESGKPARRLREPVLEDLNDKFLEMRAACRELLEMAAVDPIYLKAFDIRLEKN